VLKRLPREEVLARVVEALTDVNLDPAEVLNKTPAELSGGMRKRAGLARAIALEPRLLLFDEPSAGLDPITARELDDLILSLKEQGTMGIVVVSHELSSVNVIADRAVMLADGKVLASGSLDEVRADPAPLVQAFFRREVPPHAARRSILDELEWPA
jgi:phospholipid/cholesterol/gamma-HCH transport system ATP-binding protein